MGKRLGLYVSLSEDGTLHRTLVSVSGETQLEPTTANKKPSDKDLTYAEYYEWLEDATAARDDYLVGKISEGEALAIIKNR